jgi:CHAT domain/Effector-associated domain 11
MHPIQITMPFTPFFNLIKEEKRITSTLTTEIQMTLNKATIQALIAKARIDEAIELFLTTDNEAIKKEASIISVNNEGMKRKSRLGLASNQELGIDRAKIANALLNLCDELNPSTITMPNQNTTIVTGDSNIVIQDVSRSNISIHKKSIPLEGTSKQKILFIAANPSDEARLATDKEYRNIKAEMQRGKARDCFEFLQPQFAATIDELMRAMNERPNIVHFSGHGEKEGIIITKSDNTYQLLPTAALRLLFKPLAQEIQLVLFNSCYSAEQAEEISKLGMYVVGHNLPVGDAAAISFARGLYNGLGEGKSFLAAYNDAMIQLITENAEYASVVEVWKDGQQQVM